MAKTLNKQHIYSVKLDKNSRYTDVPSLFVIHTFGLRESTWLWPQNASLRHD